MRNICITLTALALFTIAGCGNGQTSSPIAGGGAGGAVTDWSSLGVNTVTSGAATSSVEHADYLVGSHSGFKCSDCHSLTQAGAAPNKAAADLPREKICAYCHPFSKYSSLMTNVNHVGLNTGDHCNACHYSASGVAGSSVSGWRWPSVPSPKTRVPHSQWHADFTGKCLDCHSAANEANYPANHSTSGCETCHSYGNGTWKGARGHLSVTSGCNQTGCHADRQHNISGSSVTANSTFPGRDCAACHKASVTSGYVNWKGAVGSDFHPGLAGACASCHNPSSIPTYPSNHYTSGCETCHTSYNNGSWKGARGHVSATSGCRATG